MATIPEVEVPSSLVLKGWSKSLEEAFFEVYTSSFKERPGFPGWSQEKWVDWISSDADFRSDLTYLAYVEDQAVGFVATANDSEFPNTHGYIIQVGVIPGWRRQSIAKTFISRSLASFRTDGKKTVTLHVNQNNAGAVKLYQQLGFKTVRIRGAFEK